MNAQGGEKLVECTDVRLIRETTSARRWTFRGGTSGFREGGLLLVQMLVTPLVIVGYVGLAAVLFLPLCGIRQMLSRRSTRMVVRGIDDVPLCPGLGNVRSAATSYA